MKLNIYAPYTLLNFNSCPTALSVLLVSDAVVSESMPLPCRAEVMCRGVKHVPILRFALPNISQRPSKITPS